MLKVRSHDLHQLLSQAALFAHQDRDLPTINTVLLEFDGTNLVAIATDRFKMAAVRLSLGDLDDDQKTPFKASLTLDDVKVLIGHLKTPKAQQEVRQAVLDIGNGDALNIGDGLPPNMFSVPTRYDSTSAITFKAEPAAGPFPNWRKLMDLRGDDPTIGGIALAPRHLDAFIKVAKLRNNEHMSLRFRGPNHAVIVRIGHDFAGLIMPIRADHAYWDHPDWLVSLLDDKAAGK